MLPYWTLTNGRRTKDEKGHFQSWCIKISHNDLSFLHLMAQCQPHEEVRNLPHPLGENTIGFYMSEKEICFMLSHQDLGVYCSRSIIFAHTVWSHRSQGTRLLQKGRNSQQCQMIAEKSSTQSSQVPRNLLDFTTHRSWVTCTYQYLQLKNFRINVNISVIFMAVVVLRQFLHSNQFNCLNKLWL